MPKRSSTRKPKEDFSQAAFRIVQELTAERSAPDATLSTALNDADLRKKIMREMGRRGGQKGGVGRANSLSAEKRSDIARKAALSRWSPNAKSI